MQSYKVSGHAFMLQCWHPLRYLRIFASSLPLDLLNVLNAPRISGVYLVRYNYPCRYRGDHSLMQITAIHALGYFTVLEQADHCFPEGSSNHKCTALSICPFCLPFSLPSALVASQLQASHEQIFGCLLLSGLLVKYLGKVAILCSSLKCRKNPKTHDKWCLTPDSSHLI